MKSATLFLTFLVILIISLVKSEYEIKESDNINNNDLYDKNVESIVLKSVKNVLLESTFDQYLERIEKILENAKKQEIELSKKYELEQLLQNKGKVEINTDLDANKIDSNKRLEDLLLGALGLNKESIQKLFISLSLGGSTKQQPQQQQPKEPKEKAPKQQDSKQTSLQQPKVSQQEQSEIRQQEEMKRQEAQARLQEQLIIQQRELLKQQEELKRQQEIQHQHELELELELEKVKKEEAERLLRQEKEKEKEQKDKLKSPAFSTTPALTATPTSSPTQTQTNKPTSTPDLSDASLGPTIHVRPTPDDESSGPSEPLSDSLADEILDFFQHLFHRKPHPKDDDSFVVTTSSIDDDLSPELIPIMTDKKKKFTNTNL